MLGYVETAEIMNDCPSVVGEVRNDLRGAAALLHSIASDPDEPQSRALELISHQLHAMASALDTALPMIECMAAHAHDGAGGGWTVHEPVLRDYYDTCCICGKLIPKGHGNNPSPVCHDEAAACCSECNENVVLPARALLGGVPGEGGAM